MRTFATVHDVEPGEKQRTLGPGVCLTRDDLDAIVRKIARTSAETDTRNAALIPSHLLYEDAKTLIWWKPEHTGPIYFRTGNKQWNEQMSEQDVRHPALLFCATSGRLKVWALAEDVRPTVDTVLYQAPYYNIYKEGAMCTGSAPLPLGIDRADIDTWERCFLETNFTHTNILPEKLVGHPSGHDGYWRGRRVTEPQDTKFYLMPADQTVGGLLP
jgi:PRTRC genetic system protein B